MNSWATSGEDQLLHFSVVEMGISFIAAAWEQVRLRNGCCALSAISAPRARGTDRWGTWHEAVTPVPLGSIWQSCCNGALHSQDTSYKLLVQATASYFMGLTNVVHFWRTPHCCPAWAMAEKLKVKTCSERMCDASLGWLPRLVPQFMLQLQKCCLYNFSFHFPWSRDIKHIFCTSRSACV